MSPHDAFSRRVPPPAQIAESRTFGKLLAHLARGATYPQAQIDDSYGGSPVRPVPQRSSKQNEWVG
jgi:hypothetical protein